MIFFNRKEELQGLDRLFERERGRLAIAYGRRGIGKTTLVQRWLTTRRPRALYWCAPTTTAKQQLQSFSQAVRAFKSSNRSVPSDFTYASWNDAFDEILRLAERDSLVVILDDFEQLIAAGSDLPSALQCIWDLRLQDSNVMLFLIGSNVYAMEYDVLSYRAPMYGRAGWIDYLRPRPFADLKTLLPNYSMIDRITGYACVGGVPRFLELLDPQLPLTQNLLRVASSPLMLEDAGNLLREQFDKPHLYAVVLAALARGDTDSRQIAQVLGVEHRDILKCLKSLERAKIICWTGPATSRFPDTSRLGYYRLVDQYLLFYFHCLASTRSLHERGKTKEAMAQHRASLDEFIGTGVFPGLCREWLYRQWETLPFHPMHVGANWGEGIQPIDLVAINHEITGFCLANAIGASNRLARQMFVRWWSKPKSRFHAQSKNGKYPTRSFRAQGLRKRRAKSSIKRNAIGSVSTNWTAACKKLQNHESAGESEFENKQMNGMNEKTQRLIPLGQ